MDSNVVILSFLYKDHIIECIKRRDVIVHHNDTPQYTRMSEDHGITNVRVDELKDLDGMLANVSLLLDKVITLYPIKI